MTENDILSLSCFCTQLLHSWTLLKEPYSLPFSKNGGEPIHVRILILRWHFKDILFKILLHLLSSPLYILHPRPTHSPQLAFLFSFCALIFHPTRKRRVVNEGMRLIMLLFFFFFWLSIFPSISFFCQVLPCFLNRWNLIQLFLKNTYRDFNNIRILLHSEPMIFINNNLPITFLHFYDLL